MKNKTYRILLEIKRFAHKQGKNIFLDIFKNFLIALWEIFYTRKTILILIFFHKFVRINLVSIKLF